MYFEVTMPGTFVEMYLYYLFTKKYFCHLLFIVIDHT